jgi:hypothetical protein
MHPGRQRKRAAHDQAPERPDSVTVDELIKWLHKNDDMYNEEQNES